MLNPETKAEKLIIRARAILLLGRRRFTKKRLLVSGGGLVLLLIGVVGIFAFWSGQKDQELISPQAVEAEGENLPPATPEPVIDEGVERFGVMLLGYGGAGHQGGYLTDIIQVMEIDFGTNTITLVSIPRDLWVGVAGGRKINEVMALGLNAGEYPKDGVVRDKVISGVETLKRTVAEVTGINVTNFVGVDFGGFEALVNSLGGIRIKLDETVADDWYPVRGRELELCGLSGEQVTAMSATMSGFLLEKQFPCRYEKLYYPAGRQSINGQEALKIARSRHGSSDFGRSGRQMAMLAGIWDKLLSIKALENVTRVYESFQRMVVTDIKLDQVAVLSQLTKNRAEMKMARVNLSTENVLVNSTSGRGQFILVPKDGAGNWSQVQSYVKAEKAKAKR